MRWLIQTYKYEVLGNYDHYLTCDELPTIEEARNILLKYPDMKEQIEKISTGNVVIQIDDTKCYGKADILIHYATISQRNEIERIMGGKTFMGIPVRLKNQ
jgi:hypothetical protein